MNRSLARTSKEIDHQSCRTSLFNPLRALLIIAGLVSVTLAQPATGSAAGDIANQPVSGSLEELAGSVEHEHPLATLELSKRLWEAGRKDEAVFFFYLGQLRFRAHLLANRNGDPTGGRALFDALMSTMGPPINQYAFWRYSGIASDHRPGHRLG